MMGAGSVTYALSLLTGLTGGLDLTAMVTVGVVGALLYGSAKLRLPRWAQTRERQMEGVIERLSTAVEVADQARHGEGT